MNLYFDTEFTGLHKDTTLVSLGIIDEEGRTFYAEFGDYDHSQVDEWIEENVIDSLLFHKKDGKGWCNSGTVDAGESDSRTEVYGNREFVAEALRDWLQDYADHGEQIQMVSDVSHYDFVLFIDLFGTAFDLPKNINPSCHDINQDIAKFMGISGKDAFDASREVLAGLDASDGVKHNALWDANVIKTIYDLLGK